MASCSPLRLALAPQTLRLTQRPPRRTCVQRQTKTRQISMSRWPLVFACVCVRSSAWQVWDKQMVWGAAACVDLRFTNSTLCVRACNPDLTSVRLSDRRCVRPTVFPADLPFGRPSAHPFFRPRVSPCGRSFVRPTVLPTLRALVRPSFRPSFRASVRSPDIIFPK